MKNSSLFLITISLNTLILSNSFASIKPSQDALDAPVSKKVSQNTHNNKIKSDFNFFSKIETLECSPIKDVGCSGLFSTHEEGANQIGLLNHGEQSLMARLQSLQNAKKSIRIQALVLKGDESGKKIANLLIEKKASGLDVKVIVDAFSNLDLETQLLYYKLKLANIELEGYEAAYLQWFNEVNFFDLRQVDKRFHDKMWIIDGEDHENRVAIIGGLNIANEYFRVGDEPSKIWRDQDFIVKGKVIDDIIIAFDRNFQDQKKIKREKLINTDNTWEYWKMLFNKEAALHPLKEDNKDILDKIDRIETEIQNFNVSLQPAKVKFIQNRPRYKETFIEQSYEKIFSSAQKSLYVMNAYFIPSEKIIESIKMAARNGAKVTLITNSPETNDLPQMAIATRNLYKDLLSVNKESGVKGSLIIREWVGHQHNEGTMHAKFAVIDEKLIIGGSYNLDPRSALLNSETVMVFEQPQLASELVNYIIKNDFPKTVVISEVQAEEFYKPSNILDRILHFIWNIPFVKGEM